MARSLEEIGKPIRLNNIHIAAHARSEGLTLVTNNLHQFERVPTLQLEKTGWRNQVASPTTLAPRLSSQVDACGLLAPLRGQVRQRARDTHSGGLAPGTGMGRAGH